MGCGLGCAVCYFQSDDSRCILRVWAGEDGGRGAILVGDGICVKPESCGFYRRVSDLYVSPGEGGRGLDCCWLVGCCYFDLPDLVCDGGLITRLAKQRVIRIRDVG
jgi:hypothetical protein